MDVDRREKSTVNRISEAEKEQLMQAGESHHLINLRPLPEGGGIIIYSNGVNGRKLQSQLEQAVPEIVEMDLSELV